MTGFAASKSQALNQVAAGESGLTPQQRVQRIRSMVRLLDQAIRVPGTRFRFGLDGIIGLVPVAGDIVTAVMSAYIINEARQLGVPRHVRYRMMVNMGVDVVLGAVPLVGDAVDFMWKANLKNLRLLEKHLPHIAGDGS